MGIWQQYSTNTATWNPALLLLGIRGKGTSQTHGYREMVLDNITGHPTGAIKENGDSSPTSVSNKPKYTASLGIHPVTSILQVPDIAGSNTDYSTNIGANPAWEPPIFASTSLNGLWSYRNGEWNAED
jgi:hypothetical protein